MVRREEETDRKEAEGGGPAQTAVAAEGQQQNVGIHSRDQGVVSLHAGTPLSAAGVSLEIP